MCKGMKLCLVCGIGNGPRSLLCKACNSVFMRKSTNDIKYIGAGKGRKICPCGAVVGARKRECECGHKFDFKPSSKPAKAKQQASVKWQDLAPGDVIKVSKGPYWRDLNGVKHSMGHKGRYTVKRLESNGILATNGYGYAFIYMGPKEHMKDTNIHRRPHKLMKMKVK